MPFSTTRLTVHHVGASGRGGLYPLHAFTRKGIGDLWHRLCQRWEIDDKPQREVQRRNVPLVFKTAFAPSPEKPKNDCRPGQRPLASHGIDPALVDKKSAGIPACFLPPYSPELNAMEWVWKINRRLCTHNRYFPALD